MAFLKRRLSNLNLNLNESKEKEQEKASEKFLVDTKNPTCAQNVEELKLMHWIFSQAHSEPESTDCIKLIKRISTSQEAQSARKRAQWVTSYNEQHKALLVWIMGTQNEYDWKNLLNVCHQQVQLQKPSPHRINVHDGVYNAVNNVLFYAPLFADIHIHFSDPSQQIERIILGGHSQGGAIAQLMYMLWRGQVECEFVDYFKEQMASTDFQIEFDHVYTLGPVLVVSHSSMLYVDSIFGTEITNVINAHDPIPQMYAGNNRAPPQPLKASKKLGTARMAINKYGQAMMDNFHRIASFGPIGKWIVFIDTELRVLCRKQNEDLFHQHLVHGACTFAQSKAKFSDIPTLLKLQKHHLYVTYKANLDRILHHHVNAISNLDA
mmetsp:Transcript_21354/g.34185  ORF Transcript_21354/g.34185 Transcript_21354/m.34185 type:complete len:379 (+) Transcript_21354:867-2003(+)